MSGAADLAKGFSVEGLEIEALLVTFKSHLLTLL